MRSLIMMLALTVLGLPTLAHQRLANPYSCSANLVYGRESADCQNADVELYDLTASDWNRLVCGTKSFSLATYTFYRDVNGGLQSAINGSTCVWELFYNP